MYSNSEAIFSTSMIEFVLLAFSVFALSDRGDRLDEDVEISLAWWHVNVKVFDHLKTKDSRLSNPRIDQYHAHNEQQLQR